MENRYFVLSRLHVTLSLLGLLILEPMFGSAAKPPAIFILGDSTVDVGTNSYLQESKARSDFPHYGIDFPNSRPTGRFSNGLNGADFLGNSISVCMFSFSLLISDVIYSCICCMHATL